MSFYVKNNLSLAWPLAINALLMQSMLMVDTFFVSPLGEVSLAAMGIATTIVSFILGIQMALANGSQLVMSRAIGSGNMASMNKSFWAALMINVACAIVFWIILALFNHTLIAHLTNNPALYVQAERYLELAKFIIMINAITQVLIALFNAQGKTKIAFAGYLIELPINAMASYLFIHGYGEIEGLGLQGAATGSLLAILIRLGYLTHCFQRDCTWVLSVKHLDSSLKTNTLNHLREIFPVAANVAMLQVGATFYMLLYSQLTLNAYVAMTIVMPWIKAGTQFITAWAHSSAITISQAIGSGNVEKLVKIVDISINIAVIISFVSAAFFLALSLVLAALYPDLDHSTYQALTVIAPLYIFLPIVRGYNTVHGHVLRALGKTTGVFIINFTGQWLISIPLCALIIFYFDASFFWAFAVMPFEEIVKALPFRSLARQSLKAFNSKKARNLMYD